MSSMHRGGVVPAHSTDRPVTVHLLDGEIEFSAAGRDYPLAAGDILVFAPGVEHSERSAKGRHLFAHGDSHRPRIRSVTPGTRRLREVGEFVADGIVRMARQLYRYRARARTRSPTRIAAG